MFDRLDWKRPPHKLKTTFSQRVDLKRPPGYKLACPNCQLRIQKEWEFCPKCSSLLVKKEADTYRRCVWIDMSGIAVKEESKVMMASMLMDAFSKVFGAFRSVNIYLTSDPPGKEYNQDFTHVHILVISEQVDYLGVASFVPRTVTDLALVRIDKVLEYGIYANLESNQISNLIANTIAHEVGHTLGLDHSDLPTDVMHDGVDYKIHSYMPPSFHGEQINAMNQAIRKHNKQKAK